MSSLKRITLHLARDKQHPEGSIRHGYTFVAPLDEAGRIDAAAYAANRGACTVHRFWADEPEQVGWLKHKPGGAGGATWGFDYDANKDTDDEYGHRFGDHAFVAGEYVSVRDDGGVLHTFRVAGVKPF